MDRTITLIGLQRGDLPGTEREAREALECLQQAGLSLANAHPELQRRIADLLGMPPSDSQEPGDEPSEWTIVDALNYKGIYHLHYMANLNTLASIAVHGIWSYHTREGKITKPEIQAVVDGVGCCSISDPGVQERREDKRIPGGRYLHSYVPLYFCTHTPMQYRVTKNDLRQQDSLGFAEVDLELVFRLDDVWYSNGNAASDETHFFQNMDGIDEVDWELILWQNCRSDSDYVWRKAAEVLVPERVPQEYVIRYKFLSNNAVKHFRRRLKTAADLAGIDVPGVDTRDDPSHFYTLEEGRLRPND